MRIDIEINEIKLRDINPYICGQWIFDKDVRTIPLKNSLYKWCWKNWISTGKRMKLDPYTIFKKLTRKGKTIKLLEENESVNLHDLGLGSVFLNVTPKAQAAKERYR